MGLFTRKGLTELEQTVQIQPGAEVLPGWKITEPLGEGGFGSAWCIERSTGSAKMTEALKVIQVLEGEHFQIMLQRELDTMLILREHPNIVRCDDFVFANVKTDKWTGKALMIRMELLTPLDTYFIRNRPDEKEIVRMATDILTALDQLYKHNMLHRDIKPANIFCNNFGVYKLGDYGLARTVNKDPDPAADQNLSTCGTKPFMAPEMFLGQEYDHTVDMYALALTMYLYLNGGRFDSFPSPIVRLMGWEPEAKNMSPWLHRALRKALAFNPKERFAKPEDFLNALKDGGQAAEEETAKPAVQAPVQPEKPAEPEQPVQPVNMTSRQRTQQSMEDHRARLAKSIQDSASSSAAFLNEHLNRKD